MSNVRHNAKICGDIVYTYSFSAWDNRDINSDLSDDDFFGSRPPRYRDVDSYSSHLEEYRLYLKNLNNIVVERLSSYLSMGFDPDFAHVLASTGFYRFTPSDFGLYNISESALARSRRRLRDLIFCNLSDSKSIVSGKFVTLTYRTPQFSPTIVKSDFALFIKRFRYYLDDLDFRYIAIPEKHQSSRTATDRYGSYHFHVLIFDTGFLDNADLTSIWSHGFVYVKKLYGDSTAIANYVAKYVTKDLSIDFGRRFLYSRNCYKPEETSDFSTLPPLRHISTSVYTSLSGERLNFTINRVLK